jgi:hypothetical protein
MALRNRPVCDVCGRVTTMMASENGVRRYRCTNTACSDFCKRDYTEVDSIESASPERKE